MVVTEVHAGVETVRPGRKLFVRHVEAGKGSKPQVQLIFQHGLCATEQQFQLVLDCIDRQSTWRIRCLLYDSIGCGQSSRPVSARAYENSQVAADLASVAECFADPSLPTVWICHSYGSTVLLKMLEKNPQLVPGAGFIFLSTAVRSDKLPLADGGHPLMKLPVFLLNCLQKTMTNAFVNMAVHPSRKDVQEMVREGGNDNDMAAAKCCHRNMEWATVNDLNGPIKDQPALVLHGVDDGIIPLECGQHLANQLPQSKFVALEKASHLIMLELPEAVSNEILAFLETFLSEEVTL